MHNKLATTFIPVMTLCTPCYCSQADKLIEGIEAECLITDKGYDTDEVVRLAIDDTP